MGTTNRESSRSLGYPFTPIPDSAFDLVSEGKLLPIDLHVLGKLLRFRSQRPDSAWASIATLVSETGQSKATVCRSIDRLKSAGLLSHVEVSERGEADPFDPQNRTGWRWFFPFISAPVPVSPVRQPLSHRRDSPCLTSETQDERELISERKKNQYSTPHPQRGRDDSSRFSLPDWVPEDSWSDYEDHIEERQGRPMDDAFRRKQVAALSVFREKGYSLSGIIERTINYGWVNLKEPRE